MSETSQFRQYADEAMNWAIQSKTEKEKATLLELARTWMRAAIANGSQLQTASGKHGALPRHNGSLGLFGKNKS
jgi:hypothetical protein